MQMNKPELLAPAGDLEKLFFAYSYGADAAYIGGGDYSLRLNSGFTLAEIKEAVSLARQMGKKLYIAVNAYMRNQDISALPEYLQQLAAINPDALIISDPGTLLLAQTYAPKLAIHISTQTNNTNWLAADFWHRQGAARIILGRELSLAEAAEISAKSSIETEIFVHGAMCISYSGRCLLSSVMTSRSANQGNCSHPCRYSYALMEEKRPGEYFAISEDVRGSYIMNSKDLCLLDYIPALCQSGFAGLKIEGRNKSAYYVANAVRIYRAAIDAYCADPAGYHCQESWPEELTKISHREYTDAFAQHNPGAESMRYEDGGYVRGYDFTAVLKEKQGDKLVLEQRNHIGIGDELEILLPGSANIGFNVQHIYDEDGLPLTAARHPRQIITIPAEIEEDIACPLIVRRPAK